MRSHGRQNSRRSKGAVRLWRRGDEHEQEVLLILSRVWSLDTAQALQKAVHPERQIWLWLAADDKAFRGLIVLSTSAPALFGLENAFASLAQRQLLQASRSHIYHVELIWARCGQCETQDVVRRVLAEICQRLRASDDDKALVCPIRQTDKNRALAASLQALGFSVYGDAHVDFLLDLSAANNVLKPVSLPDDWVLRNFSEPPDVDNLLIAVAKVFAKSGSDLIDDHGVDLIESNLADPNFLPEASYYLSSPRQLGGFVWVYAEEGGPARLGLAALIPELRQMGIARQAFAQLAKLWIEQGHQALHFSIAAHNKAALHLAQFIAGQRKTARQTWVWNSRL